MFAPLLAMLAPTVVPDLGLRDPAAPDGRLPVRATIPEGKGPFPVLVWSHGGGLNKDDYDPVVTALASRGYAVLQPTHRDSLVYATAEQKEAFRPGEALTTDNWADRARQVSLVLDRLDELASTHPDVKGRIDPKRVAVGGHGVGADTAQLVGGAVVGNGETRSFRHALPKAFLLVSPQGVPRLPLTATSAVERPVLLVSGDQDIVRRDRRPAAWRRQAFEAMPKGAKHLLWFRDGAPDFGGIVGRKVVGGGDPNPNEIATLAAVMTAFLDAYVGENAAAKQALTSSGVRLSAPATLTSR